MPTSPTPTGTELPLLTDCCTPVVGEVIQPSQAGVFASGFKALGDPARLRLISLVAAHESAEACVCELTNPTGLSQPTVSHHLKILVDAGILTRQQRGKWAYYGLVPETLNALAASSPRRRCDRIGELLYLARHVLEMSPPLTVLVARYGSAPVSRPASLRSHCDRRSHHSHRDQN